MVQEPNAPRQYSDTEINQIINSEPEKVSLSWLAEVGIKNLYYFNNNFYFWLSGYKRNQVGMLEEILEDEGLTDEKRENFARTRDRITLILGAVDEVVAEMQARMGFSNETLRALTDRDFLHGQVIGFRFSELSNMNEENAGVITAVHFVFEVYQQMRLRGFSHWEDLSI